MDLTSFLGGLALGAAAAALFDGGRKSGLFGNDDRAAGDGADSRREIGREAGTGFPPVQTEGE